MCIVYTYRWNEYDCVYVKLHTYISTIYFRLFLYVAYIMLIYI